MPVSAGAIGAKPAVKEDQNDGHNQTEPTTRVQFYSWSWEETYSWFELLCYLVWHTSDYSQVYSKASLIMSSVNAASMKHKWATWLYNQHSIFLMCYLRKRGIRLWNEASVDTGSWSSDHSSSSAVRCARKSGGAAGQSGNHLMLLGPSLAKPTSSDRQSQPKRLERRSPIWILHSHSPARPSRSRLRHIGHFSATSRSCGQHWPIMKNLKYIPSIWNPRCPDLATSNSSFVSR